MQTPFEYGSMCSRLRALCDALFHTDGKTQSVAFFLQALALFDQPTQCSVRQMEELISFLLGHRRLLPTECKEVDDMVVDLLWRYADVIPPDCFADRLPCTDVCMQIHDLRDAYIRMKKSVENEECECAE